jgi:hypothetical protein
MRTMIISMLVASAVVSLGAFDASAKPKHHHVVPQYVDEETHELPLTVNKRSFLDPGPVAPVGTGTNYMSANTIYNKTPDQITNPDQYGNDTMKGQPYIPGRTVPVAEFATGPNVGDLYSGPILGYQPPQLGR